MGNCNIQQTYWVYRPSVTSSWWLSKVTECKNPSKAFKDLENELVFAKIITTLLWITQLLTVKLNSTWKMPYVFIYFRSHGLHGVCTSLRYHRCQNREDERWAKDKERERLWAIKQMCWGSPALFSEELWQALKPTHLARQALGPSHPQGWSPLGKDQVLGDITMMRTLDISGGKFTALHLNTTVKASTNISWPLSFPLSFLFFKKDTWGKTNNLK